MQSVSQSKNSFSVAPYVTSESEVQLSVL